MERLTEDNLRELSARARAGDVESRNAIVMANRGLAGKFARGDEDRFQGAMLDMLRGAANYDPEKGAMGTYFGWYIRRGMDRDGPLPPAGAPIPEGLDVAALGVSSSLEAEETAGEVRGMIDGLIGVVDDDQREILRLRFLGGTFRTQKEVAELIGVRRQLVQDAEARAIERMRRAARSCPATWEALEELVA